MVRRIFYFIMVLLALFIYSMQRLNFPLPKLVNNYVNDLLCLPLLLGGLTFLIPILKKDECFTFPLAFVLVLATYYSVYFEYYLPEVNSRYTADGIDVALYFSSAITFFLFQNRKKTFARMCKLN